MSASLFEYVVDKENFTGFVQSILVNGKSSYTGETAEDFKAKGYTILSEEEFDAFQKEYETSLCNDWSEILEEDYEQALNVLPPRKMVKDGFYIGEPTYGSLYGFYQKYNGKYYTSLQSIFTPHHQIMESLTQFLAAA